MKKVIMLSSALLLSISLAGCGSSSSDKSSENTNQAKTEQKESASKKDEVYSKVFNVGEEANVNGVKVKVNNIRYSNGDDVETPDQGKKYMILNVTITNDSDKTIDYNELDFKFNVNGNSKDPDTVTLDGVNDLGSGSLDKNASLTKDLVGQVPVDENGQKIQLTYQPNSLDDNKLVHFNLNQQ
ncbi:DUF4352 domain-containing protein [Ligilactobacillus cholophilus]|uniref:DUF4352 domain-containing protein n=1 Tax=Ligilactobacillus cholophilus TaxID=3050131 RepID=UPI0025B1CEBC|nr:DUF4352 domain-containing protein [Ligilactobacillus cholophilus]